VKNIRFQLLCDKLLLLYLPDKKPPKRGEKDEQMNKYLTLAALGALLLLSCAPEAEQQTQAPDNEHNTSPAAEMQTQSEHGGEHSSEHASHKIYFVSPQAGERLKSPVKVVMMVEGMGVQPAGELVENTGHHHVIINGGPIATGEVIAADDTHIHFGQGQTEAELELPAGEHSLTLQFADGHHKSYGPEMSSTITITVE